MMILFHTTLIDNNKYNKEMKDVSRIQNRRGTVGNIW